MHPFDGRRKPVRTSAVVICGPHIAGAAEGPRASRSNLLLHAGGTPARVTDFWEGTTLMSLRSIDPKHNGAAKAAGALKSRRGRPPKKVFINVQIRATTRDALNHLKRKAGLRNQGQVLDFLVTGKH